MSYDVWKRKKSTYANIFTSNLKGNALLIIPNVKFN
jgi:hypothetical protein